MLSLAHSRPAASEIDRVNAFLLRRFAPVLTAVAASGVLLAAQSTTAPPPQAPQQPTFRSRVDTVLVDVSVTDKQGRPVTDLKQEDFEIREAGKPQTIESFKLFVAADPEASTSLATRHITSFSDQQREGADPENRLLVIFLDDYHTRVGNSMQVRESLAAFVRQLTPRDLVAVLYPLTPISAATFSRNHDATAEAILRFHGRKYDYQPKGPYEEQYANAPPEVIEQLRNELTIRALASACVFMGGMREGRKVVLFVSEGMTATLPPGVRTMGTPIMNRPMTGTDPASTQAFFRETELMSRMRDIFGAATRNNTSIYTMDPRGLATGEFGAGDNVSMEADRQVLQVAIDSLRTIADQTDGKAIVNRNDPVPELKKMVQELSSYYMLGYTSTVAARDGKFHPIQVRVKRPNVEWKARKGYWALTEDEARAMSATPKPGPTAEVASALDEMAGVIEPAARKPANYVLASARGTAEKSKVTLIWEIRAASQDPMDKVRQIAATITSAAGDELFKGTLSADAAGRQAGKITFEAPPGLVKLRMIAQNAQGQRVDQDDFTYEVADFTSTRVQISTPMLFRGRTARDIAQLKGGTDAIPDSARQFSRTERLLMRFDAYGPAGTTPKVTLRLLNKEGGQIAPFPDPTPVPSTSTYESELVLSPLPPGDYLFEITATAGDDTIKKLVALKITG